jgi:hypothetical protein
MRKCCPSYPKKYPPALQVRQITRCLDDLLTVSSDNEYYGTRELKVISGFYYGKFVITADQIAFRIATEAKLASILALVERTLSAGMKAI